MHVSLSHIIICISTISNIHDRDGVASRKQHDMRHRSTHTKSNPNRAPAQFSARNRGMQSNAVAFRVLVDHQGMVVVVVDDSPTQGCSAPTSCPARRDLGGGYIPLKQFLLTGKFILVWVGNYGKWAARLQRHESGVEEDHP